MALTDDQKAMIRLLAQREEGYEDIAALMGLSVEEVRARVKEALTEVEEAETPVEPAKAPDPPPPTPAPAPEPQAEEQPAPPEPAAPKTTAPAQPSAAKATPGPTRAQRPSLLGGVSLPKDRGARIGLAAGALAVVALIVVLAVSGSSSPSSTTTSADGEGAGTTTTASESSELTEATLSPTNGGDASGRALFGRYKKSVLLQVEAEGLDPPPKGQSYTVWLYRSPKLALRIGAVAISDSGEIAAQLPVPAQVLAYVAGGAFNQVDISLTADADYKAALAKAKQEKGLPPFTGESILRGEITGPAIKKQ